MYKITFIQECSPRRFAGDEEKPVYPGELVAMGDFVDPVDLAEYFHEEDDLAHFSNGVCEFKYKNDKLFLHQSYLSHFHPTMQDIDRLWDYTRGQNSDGWGEGFEQNPFPGTEDIYVTPPWSKKAVPGYTIEEVGDKPAEPMIKVELTRLQYSIVLQLLQHEVTESKTEPLMMKIRQMADLAKATKEGTLTPEMEAQMQRSAEGMTKWYEARGKTAQALVTRLIKQHGMA